MSKNHSLSSNIVLLKQFEELCNATLSTHRQSLKTYVLTVPFNMNSLVRRHPCSLAKINMSVAL